MREKLYSVLLILIGIAHVVHSENVNLLPILLYNSSMQSTNLDPAVHCMTEGEPTEEKNKNRRQTFSMANEENTNSQSSVEVNTREYITKQNFSSDANVQKTFEQYDQEYGWNNEREKSINSGMNYFRGDENSGFSQGYQGRGDSRSLYDWEKRGDVSQSRFNVASQSRLNEGNQMRFNEGTQSRFNQGTQSRLNEDTQMRFKAGSQSRFNEGSQSRFNEGSQMRINEGSQVRFNEGNQARFNEGGQFRFNEGSQSTFNGGKSIQQYASKDYSNAKDAAYGQRDSTTLMSDNIERQEDNFLASTHSRYPSYSSVRYESAYEMPHLNFCGNGKGLVINFNAECPGSSESNNRFMPKYFFGAKSQVASQVDTSSYEMPRTTILSSSHMTNPIYCY